MFSASLRLCASGLRSETVDGRSQAPQLARPALSQLAAPLLIVLILAMMVLPLPPFVLDLLFTFNIAVSMLVLLVAVYAHQAARFLAVSRPCC